MCNRLLESQNSLGEDNTILVIGFKDEVKACEGLQALQDQHGESSINFQAKAVLVRGTDGELTMREKAEMRPARTAVGLLTGMLVGL